MKNRVVAKIFEQSVMTRNKRKKKKKEKKRTIVTLRARGISNCPGYCTKKNVKPKQK